MAEFKKISETEVVEAPEENDTLLLISNGEVKQVSAAAFAAAAGGGGAEPIRLINTNTSGYYGNNYTLEDGSPIPSNLYDLYLAGTPILIASCEDLYHRCWFTVIGARLWAGSGESYDYYFYDYINSTYQTLSVY
jgi:hypothetical protein